MKLILFYLFKHKKLFFINLFAVLLIASAELGIPIIVAHIIDQGIMINNFSLIEWFSILLIVVAITGALGNILLNYCANRTAANILADIRNDLYSHVQTFSPKEMQELGVSTLLSRTMNDIFQINIFVATLYRSLILAPLMFIFSVVLIMLRAPQLAVGLLIVIPVIVIILILVVKLTRKLSQRQQKQLDRLNLITRENLNGVRVIRAFRKSKYEQRRFKEINEGYTDTSIKLFRIMVSIEPMFFFLLNCSILMLLFFGARFLDTGMISIGQLVEFVDYQFHVMFSILTFSLIFIMFPRTMVSASRVKEVFDKVTSIKNNEHSLKIEQIQTVEFKNVSFRYPDAEEAVISNISFKAKQGEVIAFVGSTGSGKSTLIQLIPRLYEATDGQILINGIGIDEINYYSLRSKIGFIPQKALLFDGSIRDNLAFGQTEYNQLLIDQAIEIAQAKEFIDNTELGLDHMIAEQGTNLSGGQKQRLSIARALAINPDVFIFDDSFSALDYKTDFKLRQALFDYKTKQITFIVAQRLSTIKNADQILVLDQGKVVSSGKHMDLLKTCLIYREIAASQYFEEEVK